MKLEPGNPDALWTLAETYGDKLGMTGKGTAIYRDFERQFPSDPRSAEVAARVTALEDGGDAPASAVGNGIGSNQQERV